MTKSAFSIILVCLGVLLAALAVFAKMPLVIAGFGLVAVVGAVFWRLEFGIAILAFSAILDSFVRGGFGALGPLWDDALFFLIAVALVIRLAKEGRHEFKGTLLWWAVAAFIAISITSGLFSTLPYGHIITAIRSVVQGTILYFIIINAGLDRKTTLHLISLVILCAVVVAGYGLMQRAAGVFTPQGWLDKKEVVNITRATSFLGSPNATAGFLALVLPASLGMALKVKKPWAKFLWFVAVAIIFFGLYATLNRASWLGLGVGLVVMAIAAGKRWWIMVFAAGLALAVLLLPDLRLRFSTFFTEDFATRDVSLGRSFRWGTALDIFMANPVFGLGPGSFGGAVSYGIQAFSGLYVDNYYLLILSNYGLVGVFGFLFMILATIRESFKGLVASSQADRYLIAGVIGGLVAFIVHLTFENLWDITPLNTTFWLLASLAASFAYQKGVANEGI